MKNKIWDFVKPIVVLTVISAVMAALLGGTNLLTKAKIESLAAENALPPALKKLLFYNNKNRRQKVGGFIISSYPTGV